MELWGHRISAGSIETAALVQYQTDWNVAEDRVLVNGHDSRALLEGVERGLCLCYPAQQRRWCSVGQP